ncbi:MAG: hypothetical protein SWC40_12170 [Thermodesulfobacteriota bacterium]|nr:hypothetical protein [Thermodesulfobacteriota bacterium]
MSTVMPEGETIRKAVKWVSDNLEEDPCRSVKKLVNEAIVRFDLSPVDSEFLIRFYCSKEEAQTASPD